MTIPAEAPSTTMSTTTPDVKTAAGNYFVANYPPFSFWRPERKHEALTALRSRRSRARRGGSTCTCPFAASGATSVTSRSTRAATRRTTACGLTSRPY